MYSSVTAGPKKVTELAEQQLNVSPSKMRITYNFCTGAGTRYVRRKIIGVLTVEICGKFSGRVTTYSTVLGLEGIKGA